MLCPVNRIARLALGISLLGCAAATVAQAPRPGPEYPDTHFEVYGGYSYLRPFDSQVANYSFKPVSNPAATVSVTGFFSHYLGLQVEGAYFSGNGEHHVYAPTCSGSRCDQNFYSLEAGPVLRFPTGPFVPFVHVLAGEVRMNGPVIQPITWGQGLTGGGGIDYVLPFGHGVFAIRPIQADVIYAHAHYPAASNPFIAGSVGDMKAVKLSGGLVLRFGEPSVKQGVMLGCSATPASVHAGDVVTITGSTLYLDMHRKTVFTWNSTGGHLTSNGDSATIDTTGLAPGDYTVTGKVVQGSRAREQASCSAPFTVRPNEPPTLSCSASPSTATSGTTVTINTVGTSPANRPLTYSYTASAGQITSAGPTASLSTAGLGAMVISIGCNAVDDLGQSAQAQTSVTITSPPVPVIPQTAQLCSVSFIRDRRRPVRVDNEAKACLDDVALSMNQQGDAKLVIIGNASPQENPEAAAERAMNVRQYLVQEKGLDRSRIELRVGDTSGRSVRNVLVPSGATFSDANTQLFDENTIHRHGQAYGTSHAGSTPTHRLRRRASASTPTTAAPQ